MKNFFDTQFTKPQKILNMVLTYDFRTIYNSIILIYLTFSIIKYDNPSRHLVVRSNFNTYPPFNEQFSLIIPTHHKRKGNLQRQLNRIAYGQSQHIHSIFIYWIDKNISIPPPDITEYVDLNRTKVHIEIINSPERHLTDRFKKPTNLKTRAVFSSDDDINLSPETFDSLFEMYVSNNFRNYIFGSLRRSCIHGKYVKQKPGYFNMILTGAAILDVSMLDLFQSPKYEELRNWINERFNGEDILMNYLVQDKYMTQPLAAPFGLGGGPFGLAVRPQHDQQRDDACKLFSEFFGREVLLEHPSRNVFPSIDNYLVNIE